MGAHVPTIAIIAHDQDRFRGQPRLIHLLMRSWEEMGMRLALADDPKRPPPADLAILHVSLSVVPEEYRRLAERYPRTINGRVHDIRKRRFSRLLIEDGDPYRGPVIVKTDLNAAGIRERRGIGRLGARLMSARPWSSRRTLSAYRVFPSVDRVPRGVWRNPNLVVERFRAERQGEEFLCRHWLFFGSREVTRRTVSHDPIVKLRGVMERTADPIPDALRTIRREMGFDYGKFDYGIVEGEVVLYDVNRTPGAVADPSFHAETVRALAPGIRDFLG